MYYLKNLFAQIIFTFLIGLTASPAFAGTTYTDYSTWEAAIPLGAPVTEVTFAGTPGATVADSTPFTGISALSLIYGDSMYYSGDGSQICIDPNGSTPSRFEVYLEANTMVFSLEVSGISSGMELGGYDGGAGYEYVMASAVTSGSDFRGVIFASQKDELVIIAGDVTDVMCIGPLYLVQDYDGDGYAADVDCDTSGMSCYDSDGDGYSEDDGDCDDTDAAIYPGASDTCDGIDNDCDGTSEPDSDGDGYFDCDDCDDSDATAYPGATETCDSIDNDCDGDVDEDLPCSDDDGDGYSEIDGDCDDGDPAINPGATEICNAIDDDCDGSIDEDFVDSDGDGYPDCLDDDSDGDGFTPAEGDCDDGDPAINPDAEEIAYDGIDQDCNGSDLTDVDGDGWDMAEGDCDDANATVYPGAIEILDDGIDQDCDGEDETSEPEADLDVCVRLHR